MDGRKRPLSLLERYSLARVHAGAAPIVVFTAVLRPEDPVEETQLASAIAILLERYPLLQCTVADALTTDPRWAAPDPPMEPERFIGEVFEIASGALGDNSAVIRSAFEVMTKKDVASEPLWRVWVEPSERSGQIRVISAVNHLVADGTGARNLFADLLALLYGAEPTPERPRPVGGKEPAPAMESVVDVRPSYFDIARVVYHELLLPKLPAFLQPARPPVFLRKPLAPPLEQPSAVRTATLSAATLAALKEVAKANGVATLHPVLYMSALGAILKQKQARECAIVGSSPASLRHSEPSLPYTTGNYVFDIEAIHAPEQDDAPFWEACRAYAERVRDPQTRHQGVKQTGQLALVPKAEFDAFIRQRLTKPEPFETTFEVSNLGVLPTTGWEADGRLVELAWAQTSMASTVFAINVRLRSFFSGGCNN